MKIYITGGTTGIGLDLALLYVKQGHQVAICGRDKSKLSPEILAENKNLSFYEVDVTKAKELRESVANFAPLGLDIMIANAGIALGNKTIIPDFNRARQVIDININGVINAFEAALPRMIENKKGHLVATASVAGFVGLPGASSYCASKAAVLTLCESLSLDLRQFNIDVTALAPGFIDTPLTRVNHHPMPFLMSSKKAAPMIQKAIESKKTLYAFPWQMSILMKTLKVLPRFIYRYIFTIDKFNYSKPN